METAYPAYLAEIEAGRRRAAENVVVLRTADSTNLMARRVATAFAAARAPAPRAWFLAYAQTSGRGRLGRDWSSPAGKGVYATLLLPEVAAGSLSGLPLAAGLAMCATLEPFLGRRCQLKWPNDVLVDGRKIGGVLIEAWQRGDAAPAALLGLGVNHSHSAPELPGGGATSLQLAGAELPSLAALTWRLVAAVEEELESDERDASRVARYGARSVHAPGERLRCRVGEDLVEGNFAGFDSRGFLRLRTAAGERLLSGGEVIGG
jgi:BirA family biotin operon repressor/biotin-[acetyl-CoA-carboxylase] ligase